MNKTKKRGHPSNQTQFNKFKNIFIMLGIFQTLFKGAINNKVLPDCNSVIQKLKIQSGELGSKSNYSTGIVFQAQDGWHSRFSVCF